MSEKIKKLEDFVREKWVLKELIQRIVCNVSAPIKLKHAPIILAFPLLE